MGIEDMQHASAKDEIKYPNAKQEGVTPQMEEARKKGLLMPFDEALDWLRLKAEVKLKTNDDMTQPKSVKKTAVVQEEMASEIRPYQTDPVVEMDRLILERNTVMKECDEIEMRIVQSLNGFDFEQLPLTPSRIAIAHIGKLIHVLEKNDPGVETVTQARKRLTRLLELAELRKSYMLDVEEEIRRFIDNE